MDNNSPTTIMDILHTSESSSRSFVQKFNYQDSPLTHENHIEVQITSNKSQTFEVKNYFSTVKDDKVVKVTEVHIQWKIIRIIDTFTFPEAFQSFQPIQKNTSDVSASNINSEPNATHRKTLLARKTRILQHTDGHQQKVKRDVKNVVKNIFKLFQHWALKLVNVGVKNQLRLHLQDLVKRNKKFNNQLVLALSRDPLLRSAFMAFSDGKAEQMISNSRIFDKSSHVEALHKYYLLCCDEQLGQQNRSQVCQFTDDKDPIVKIEENYEQAQ